MAEGFGSVIEEGSLKHGVHHGGGRPHPGQDHQQELAASQSLTDFAHALRFPNVGLNQSPKPLVSSKLCTQIAERWQRPYGLLPSKAASASFKHL